MKRKVLRADEVQSALEAMPTALRENAAAIFDLLAIDPTPLGSRPYGEIPGAYLLAIANLVVLYTVEEKTVSIWRVRVDT